MLSKLQEFSILILLFFTLSLGAEEPLFLSRDQNEYSLGLHLEILEDKKGDLKFEDVISEDKRANWFLSKSEIPSYGFTNSVYWIKFSLKPELKKEYYMEIAYPHLDYIDFYFWNETGNLIHKKSGDYLNFKDREIHYKNFIYIISPDVNKANVYYLRIQSSGSMQFPISIWAPSYFTEKKNFESTSLGIFYGSLLIMAFYNFFLWISVKDKSYFYYVCFIITSIISNASFQGLTFQYLLSDFPIIYNKLFPSVLFTVFLFANLFTSNFLLIRVNLPKFYTVHRILISLLILGFISAPFLNYKIATLTGLFLSGLSCIWMLICGFFILFKKYRPAYFYLLAWGMFLFSAIIFVLQILNVLPKNSFTMYSSQYAHVFEIFLLSLGLADKINILRQEKLDAEKKIKSNLEKMNLELDHKVKIQTENLTKTLEFVNKLKNNQDGDYYLLSLLIEPLSEINISNNLVTMDFLTKQKKKFVFKNLEKEIGGDLNLCQSLKINNKEFLVFVNADAMGKSLQGAGGALILASVFKSIIERTRNATEVFISPSSWLENSFLEIHRVFETFEGFMLASAAFCLLDVESGKLYNLIANHPPIILYRDKVANFIKVNKSYPNLGMLPLSRNNISAEILQLKAGDTIIIGSDGKTDILLGIDEFKNPVINEEEEMFLKIVEKCDADLEKIYVEILSTGEQYDDITMIKMLYK